MIASQLQQASTAALALLESHPVLVEFIDSHLSALEFLHHEQSHADLNTLALILSLQRIYGGNLVVRLQGISSVSSRFIELYGDGQITVLHAPARINILGEHIDYVSYLQTASLTLGSREHDMLMLFRGSDVSKVRGASTDPEYPSFVFDFGNEVSDENSSDTQTGWASYLSQHPAGAPNWANYVKGAIEFARFTFGTKLTKGFDFLVDSTVPAGSGASSSSALVVLASAAVRKSNKIKYKAEQLALDASKAEWYVGTRGGAMDHITICLARLRHAVLINYQSNHARTITLPAARFRWVTFFSSPAEKSRAVMVEYNERAAVSRVVIPALIEAWKTSEPARYEVWQQTIASLDAGSLTAIEIAEGLLETLPATISLDQLENVSPGAVAELRSSFPALVEQRCNVPLQVRSRAFHHLGEIRRVAQAIAILDSSKDIGSDIDSSMHSLGKLLDESHSSLRDLYGVSTTDLEELIEIIRSDSNVYGSRLMGGGFGGNVLAITQDNRVSELIEKVQKEYYGPRGRNALEEGSVMVSTAGDGLMELEPDIVWREALEEFNSLGNHSKYRNDVVSMLDHVSVAESTFALVPIVVAAGKGSRAQRTGLEVAKPLAMLLGVPSIVHV
ncbi:MAG TPA: galactokinase family protein, partial [Pyrinomonadaceae bacterium]